MSNTNPTSAPLIKAEAVMQRVDINGVSTYRQAEDWPRGHCLTVDPEAWTDMGEPDEITVTIEPGARLGKGGDAARNLAGAVREMLDECGDDLTMPPTS